MHFSNILDSAIVGLHWLFKLSHINTTLRFYFKKYILACFIFSWFPLLLSIYITFPFSTQIKLLSYKKQGPRKKTLLFMTFSLLKISDIDNITHYINTCFFHNFFHSFEANPKQEIRICERYYSHLVLIEIKFPYLILCLHSTEFTPCV